MKIVALVPIKLNNQRLPGKNIKSFQDGKPLIQYILTTLNQLSYEIDIYVYCSDEIIKHYLVGKTQYLKRSSELDKDETKINEVIESFVSDVNADIYLMAHATSPFITKKSIEKGLKAVLDEGKDSAFAVKALQDFMWKDGKPHNYSLDAIPRTQDLEKVFIETSGFYIFKKEVFVNHYRRIGINPQLIEVSEIEAIDIDTKEDFTLAEAILNFR